MRSWAAKPAPRSWLVLAVVILGALFATYTLARHPALPLHQDAHDMRQHVYLRRSPGLGVSSAAVADAAVGALTNAAAVSDAAAADVPAAVEVIPKGAAAPASRPAAKTDATLAPLAVAEVTTEVSAPAAVSGTAPVSDEQTVLMERVCGSPAVDGYSHVEPKCLYDSPAAQWWKKWKAGGGKREELVVHIERNADYDGLAVAWGVGFKKNSVEECAEACRQHQPNPSGGGFEPLPCNTFSFCTEETCFEPDIHKHTKGDCWLKFQEGPAAPEVNFRGRISAEARKRHPSAPEWVQWHAGVLLPPGVKPTNGTLGPRYEW